MDKIIFDLPEIDDYIISFLQLDSLINLSQTSKFSYHKITKFTKYIESKKFYQNFDIIVKYEKLDIYVFIDYYLEACSQSNIYIISYLSNKYDLSTYKIDGFINILENNNINSISWFCKEYNLLLSKNDLKLIKFGGLKLETIQFLINYFKLDLNLFISISIFTDACHAGNLPLIQHIAEKIIIPEDTIIYILDTILKTRLDLLKWFYYYFENPKIKSCIFQRFSNHKFGEIIKKYILDKQIIDPNDLLIIEFIKGHKTNMINILKNNYNFNLNILEYIFYKLFPLNLEILELICQKIDFKTIQQIILYLGYYDGDRIDFLANKYGLNNLVMNSEFRYYSPILYKYMLENKNIFLISNYQYDLFRDACYKNNKDIIKWMLSINPKLLELFLYGSDYENNISILNLDMIPLLELGLINFDYIVKNIYTQFDGSFYYKHQKYLFPLLFEIAHKNNYNLEKHIKIGDLFTIACYLSKDYAKSLYEYYKIKIDKSNIKIWLNLE